jgi:hypothetical protein
VASTTRPVHEGSQTIGVARMMRFLPRIREADIPTEAMDAMEADYWNKTSYLLWDQARDESNTEFRDRLLQQAQTSAEKALELNGRTNWTPAQLNLARIFVAQKRIDEARAVLQKILGTSPVPAATATQPPPAVDVSSIASTIIGMAPANDAIAIADVIRATWGQLTPAGLQALLPTLAGRVTPSLLSKIFERLPETTPDR